jgi:DNA-binding transcriptional ArsR family regulator
MPRGSLVEDDSPDVDVVLEAIHDEGCRTILEELDEPRTARDLLGCCDIPRSTLYRKIDKLTSATLLREGMEIHEDGSHANQYELDFEAVVISRDTDASLEVEIERPARRADDRFAELWSEVRREL